MRKYFCFDELFISMVVVGEVGGVFDEVLDCLVVMLEKNVKIVSEINLVMFYLKIVMFIVLVVFFGMIIFLLLIFVGIFE